MHARTGTVLHTLTLPAHTTPTRPHTHTHMHTTHYTHTTLHDAHVVRRLHLRLTHLHPHRCHRVHACRLLTLEGHATGREDAAAKQAKRGAVVPSVPTHGGLAARFLHAAFATVLVLGATLGVKFLLGLVMAADAHVFNLLKAKLGDYEDYDTALCVRVVPCSAVWCCVVLCGAMCHVVAGGVMLCYVVWCNVI